jgi:hypothetical protein
MTRRGLAGLSAVAAAMVAGCSLLVQFDDAAIDACADGACVDGAASDGSGPLDGGANAEARSDVRIDAPPDPCAALEAGAYCGYAGACQCMYCSNGACSHTTACPQGFNWEAGVDEARCCSGLPILTNTNANCGVCGVRCETAGVTSAQDCRLLGGHYQCANCAANSECWTGCCAIDTTPYHCAESDCNTGACVAGLCPAPSRCVQGSGTQLNYCTYD